MSLADAWRELVRHELDAAVRLRHDLHQVPRLSGDEEDTARLVADAIGLGEGTTAAGTGRLIPVAAGADPDLGPVALRTELDALPIEEQTDVLWASRNGAMHACGHDVHMAALVAVARAAQHLDLPAPLLALLQPREEGAESGARDFVAEGGLAGIDAVVAAHLQPHLPPGQIGASPGPVNASTDEFTVTVRGRGGHSGYPHTVDDPVLALAAVVTELQQIQSRRIDPVSGAVCMVTQLRAGAANNVVPLTATGSGTLRTMRPADREIAKAAMRDIVVHVAAAHGCTAELAYSSGEPTLVNDPDLAARSLPILVGMGHPVTAEFRSFGSDDFSHYCAHTRTLMLFVGTGADGGGLHEPTFLPDDGYVALVADALVAGYCAAAGQG